VARGRRLESVLGGLVGATKPRCQAMALAASLGRGLNQAGFYLSLAVDDAVLPRVQR